MVILVLISMLMIRQLQCRVGDPVIMETELELETGQRGDGFYHYMIWLAALVLGCNLLGYVIVMTIFFITFLLWKANASTRRALVLTSCAMTFMLVLSYVMVLDLPTGLLKDSLPLPWPLG